MSWKAYKVVLRLRAPLHVGAGQIGNVQHTRPYVTGRALWGALTARLTRDCPELGGDYAAVGGAVNKRLGLSYFCPAAGERVDLWPWGAGRDEFAWRYLASHAGTALDSARGAAEEGSLHEVEYIAPWSRTGAPVYLIGYILERQGPPLPWRRVLPRLQLGGERGYGWGRVHLAHAPAEECLLFGCYALEPEGERPILRAQGGVGEEVPLLAHTLADAADGQGTVTAQGAVEPLVGRLTETADRWGGQHTPAAICWVPGATVSPGTRLVVGDYGLWRAAP